VTAAASPSSNESSFTTPATHGGRVTDAEVQAVIISRGIAIVAIYHTRKVDSTL
jgi:hypothetical protein